MPGTQRIGISLHARFLAVQRWARAKPRAYDTTLAVLFSLLSVLVNQESASMLVPKHRLTWLQIVVALSAGVPHAVRRVAPFSALLMAFGLVAASIALDIPDGTVQVIVCWLVVFAVAAHGDDRAVQLTKPMLVVLTLGMLTAVTVLVFQDRGIALTGSWGKIRSLVTSYVGVLAIVGTAWFGGVASRARDAHLALLAERSRDHDEREAAMARQAVLDERVRISRELHDVVAHHVSVMGVQAGAARRVMDRDPSAAASMLTEIERSSRSAIAEMSQVLDMLRSPSPASTGSTAAGPHASGSAAAGGGDVTPSTIVDQPQPGVAQLPTLVDDAIRTGMDVTLRITGTEIELPPMVGLSVYRITQESLTNVRKHAALDATTDVELRFIPDNVELNVTNRGRIRVGDEPGTSEHVERPGAGHGLLGMRERATSVGGTLAAGPVPGGFRVRAVLPAPIVGERT